MNNTKIEDYLDEYGFYIFPPKGISMMPLLDQNEDTVRIVKCNRPLKRYDVVTFKRDNGSYVLHRILRVKKGYYLFCGDNQVICEKVYPHQIIGIMEGYYKKDIYHTTHELDYIRYSKRRVASRPFRFISYGIKAVFRKIFKRKK